MEKMEREGRRGSVVPMAAAMRRPGAGLQLLTRPDRRG